MKGWENSPCSSWACVHQNLVFSRKVSVESIPGLVRSNFFIPTMAAVSKHPFVEDEMIGIGNDFLGRVQNIYGFGVFHCGIDLFGDGFERLVGVARSMEPGVIVLEFGGCDVGVGGNEVV